MRVLDIDLDFFLHGAAFHRGPDEGRVSLEECSPWSVEDVLAFFDERCGLQGRLPGKVVEYHGELFAIWRDLIDRGTLLVVLIGPEVCAINASRPGSLSSSNNGEDERRRLEGGCWTGAHGTRCPFRLGPTSPRHSEQTELTVCPRSRNGVEDVIHDVVAGIMVGCEDQEVAKWPFETPVPDLAIQHPGVTEVS